MRTIRGDRKMPIPQAEPYALRWLATELYRDRPFPPPDKVYVTETLLIKELLKIPIFKKGSIKGDNNVYLQGDEHGQKKKLRDGGQLLLKTLASKLISHSKSIPIDSTFTRIGRIISALYDLTSLREELNALRIIDKKTLLKTVYRISDWMKRYLIHNDKGFSPRQRTRLVMDLYVCFKNSVPGIHDNIVFHCVAHILKYFGIEKKGSQKQIYERIRRDYYRKIS